MKSYLKRLAARAEGHALTPSLFPAVRNEMSRKSEPDPFAAALESDESSAAQSSQSSQAGRQVRSNDAQVTSALQYSSETVEPSAAAVSSTSRPRSVQRSRAVQAPEQVIETQSVSPKSKAATRRQEMSTREIASQAIGEGETRRGRDKGHGRAESTDAQKSGRREQRPPVFSPVDVGKQPFTGKRETGDQDEAGRPNSQGQEAARQLTPRMDAAERSAPGSLGIRRDMIGESAQTLELRRADLVPHAFSSPGVSDESSPTLEPRRADALPAAAPIPDEPRLVIGQLRVDVVATPAATREVVRVVTRTVGPGRSASTRGSLSRLRFGLRQM